MGNCMGGLAWSAPGGWQATLRVVSGWRSESAKAHKQHACLLLRRAAVWPCFTGTLGMCSHTADVLTLPAVPPMRPNACPQNVRERSSWIGIAITHRSATNPSITAVMLDSLGPRRPSLALCLCVYAIRVRFVTCPRVLPSHVFLISPVSSCPDPPCGINRCRFIF